MADVPTFAVPFGFLGITRADRDAALIVAGVPLDIGTTNRAGARDGPRAIRQASRMLVDGAHPHFWTDPATLPIADAGDFAIALGDTLGSLALIQQQAADIASTALPCRCCARVQKKAVRRSLWCISTRMSTHGPTISGRLMRMAQYFTMPSMKGWSTRSG
jgi:hypothetical protein